ncbi:MAG: Na+/proline symporter/signal transduction histidine kinase/ActR [Planctomycetota bacterium]|jgi:Na+/proline symporter/signal transduction histidine kinase/ActR/RegA family two-component response regulator
MRRNQGGTSSRFIWGRFWYSPFSILILQKLVAVSKRHKTTSIADFIATRYSKSNLLAAVVTIIALFGILPYISLQIKAITNAYNLMTGVGHAGTSQLLFLDTALVLSLILAAFSVLFGARNIDASEHHRGMIHAIGFESAVKLFAFLAIAVLALQVLAGSTALSANEGGSWQNMMAHFGSKELTSSFLVKTLLAASAIICLPRQFHVTAVEARGDELPVARWGLPIYLLLFSLAVLPITMAGLQIPGGAENADLFVLLLPMEQGNHFLTIVSYIGGFSAATGMVIVSTIALSTMVSNDLIFPLLVRAHRGQQRRNYYPTLLLVRRTTIFVLLLLAYGYYLLAGSGKSLYSIGLLSFAAAAQFMPSIIGGLYWKRGHRNGALVGLIAGFAIWLYTLLLPSLASSTLIPNAFAAEGLLGMSWLRPDRLFGIEFDSLLTHGVFWSLLFNVLGYIVFSLYSRQSFADQLQASAYVDRDEDLVQDTRKLDWDLRVSDLYDLCERFSGSERTRQFFIDAGFDPVEKLSDKVDAKLLAESERFLASTIGTATAEHLFKTTLDPETYVSTDVYQWLDKTSQAIQFNREILQVTLDNINQGVSVVDQDLRLIAWNRIYIELFEYPADFIYVGKPIGEVIRYNVERSLGRGNADADKAEIDKRLRYLKHGESYSHIRHWVDGRVIQTQGARMPDGGFITTFTDITSMKQVEQELEETNQNLERKVDERTRMLSDVNVELHLAKTVAEDATRSKTYFLAAASHDLTQPLAASKLYMSALMEDVAGDEDKEKLAASALGGLKTAESLLKSLLDISKLDSGSLLPDIKRFPLQQIFRTIDNEFSVLAAAKGLRLRVVPTLLGTESDANLLRSILQNFVSNAIRYTDAGSVMVICRRHGDQTRIEVRDSGIGIAEAQNVQIFEEFEQLDGSSEGAGLGLAICQRTAKLLQHKILMRSVESKGSCFSLVVPRCTVELESDIDEELQTYQKRWLQGIHILCVDDSADILNATQTILERWGAHVTCIQDARDFAETSAQGINFDVILMDYQLNLDFNGLNLLQQYRQQHDENFLGVIVTAEQEKSIETATRQMGFKYLSKPVEPAKLRATLQAAYRDRKLAAESGP